jgi:Zn-dependent peptidase ImmA (M78 family)
MIQYIDPKDRLQEIKANQFARALLMPTNDFLKDIQNGMSVEEISDKYQVPRLQVRIHAAELNLKNEYEKRGS